MLLRNYTLDKFICPEVSKDLGALTSTTLVPSNSIKVSTVGPLVEVPVLVALVYMMLWIGPKFFAGDATLPQRRG